MKFLPFVLWMFLWWPSIAFCNYLLYLMGNIYSDEIKSVAAIVNFVIWILIAILLYRGSKDEIN